MAEDESTRPGNATTIHVAWTNTVDGKPAITVYFDQNAMIEVMGQDYPGGTITAQQALAVAGLLIESARTMLFPGAPGPFREI